MLGAQREQGAAGLERWGEGCVGAWRTRGSGLGGRYGEGAGGLRMAWSRKNLDWSHWRVHSEGRIHGVDPAVRWGCVLPRCPSSGRC